MNWTKEKPTVPGWYAWRVGGKVDPYLSHVYERDERLRVDMQSDSWWHDYDISELADREWFGPLPE